LSSTAKNLFEKRFLDFQKLLIISIIKVYNQKLFDDQEKFLADHTDKKGEM